MFKATFQFVVKFSDWSSERLHVRKKESWKPLEQRDHFAPSNMCSSHSAQTFWLICLSLLVFYHDITATARSGGTWQHRDLRWSGTFPGRLCWQGEKKKKKVSQTDVEVGCVLLFGSFSLPYVCKVLFWQVHVITRPHARWYTWFFSFLSSCVSFVSSIFFFAYILDAARSCTQIWLWFPGTWGWGGSFMAFDT